MMRRAVYDVMIFFQWAALPEDRQHRTVKALYDGSLRLCLSRELLDEVRDVLTRPEVRPKAPSLTPDHVNQVIDAAKDLADWFAAVPRAFTLPAHLHDDHLFNLAIEAKAAYLVTWRHVSLRFKTRRRLTRGGYESSRRNCES